MRQRQQLLQRLYSNRTLLLVLVFALNGCSGGPFSWWKSVNEKAEKLIQAETNYNALKAEHEKLRIEFFRLEHDYTTLKAEVQSKERATSSLEATGTKTGRTIASVSYSVPPHLTPEELTKLAFEHFREKRFGEAAMVFEAFLAAPEGAALQNANIFYSAAISCFEMQNFKRAREFFESAKNRADGEEKDKIRKKVDLWMRAIDRKLASTNSPHGEEK